MTDSLEKLENIADALEDINAKMKDEAKVMEEELEDRKRLGLEGDAAIVHFNKWMDKHGMGYLKVPLLS